MTATPKTFEIYEDKPGPGEVEVVSVKDHIGKNSGNPGWKWTFKSVKTGELYDIYTMFSEKARWKLTETLAAFGWTSEEGLNEVDPNVYVGQIVTGEFISEEDEFTQSMGGGASISLNKVYRTVTRDDLPTTDSTLRDQFITDQQPTELDEDKEGAAF